MVSCLALALLPVWLAPNAAAVRLGPSAHGKRIYDASEPNPCSLVPPSPPSAVPPPAAAGTCGCSVAPVQPPAPRHPAIIRALPC